MRELGEWFAAGKIAPSITESVGLDGAATPDAHGITAGDGQDRRHAVAASGGFAGQLNAALRQPVRPQ